jgi:hypothetical protein
MVKIQMEMDAKCPFVPTINHKSARMMEGKSRYSVGPKDQEGLRDSQGKLEEPESIHN